ncbi:MAG: hypothetical protein KGJ05_07770, partial [Alphaproteobacteria bacterium]|nr:hypothetical protein [Alphaproteobacteria bacterium]
MQAVQSYLLLFVALQPEYMKAQTHGECIAMLIRQHRIYKVIAGVALLCGAISTAGVSEPWHYADYADLVLPAPIVAKIRVSEVIAVPSGPDHIQNSKFVRRYIEGQIETLIKGPRDVSPLIKMTV